MTREEKFCRVVHLRHTAPDSEELKRLEAEILMTPADIKAKLTELREQEAALTQRYMREHSDLQSQICNLKDLCPHEARYPYRACGVETAVCYDCGHEKHVREY